TIMVFAFAPIVGLLPGLSAIIVPWTSEDGVQLGGMKRDSRNQRLSSLQASPPRGAQCIRFAQYPKRSCKTLDVSSNVGYNAIDGGWRQTIPAKAVRVCRATERAWPPPGRFAYG